MDCNPTKYKINELVSAWRDGSLKINEEYQRGASWTTSQMQGLVDSVFRKYPIPAIFLHEIKTLGLGGKPTIRYEIVDGQQRIRALAEFFSDKFTLLDSTDKRLKLPNSLRHLPAPWGKRRFPELDEAQRRCLEQKELDVFLIVGVENPDEIRDLFIRLQSGTALSRQQIRDAWPGTVGPFIERLAGKLKKAPAVNLFKQVDRRGSRGEEDGDPYEADRQFCAQLFCLFLARESDYRSQQSIGANDLDKTYHENTTFDVNGQTAKRFQEVLDRASDVFVAATTKTLTSKERARIKFRKLDIIATMLLIQDLSRGEHFKFDKKFPQQLAHYILVDKQIPVTGRVTSGPTIARYYEAWRPGIIEGIGIHLDPKRMFDNADKQSIYNRDEGLCGVCKQSVDPEDAEYDHYPVPHSLGGRTVIDNGRLVHATCHPRGPINESEAE